MKYDICFDDKNPNSIIIKDMTGKVINYIACPPIENGCDTINFSNKIYDGYSYDFDGLILITTEEKREIYYKGILIAQTKRKNHD